MMEYKFRGGEGAQLQLEVKVPSPLRFLIKLTLCTVVQTPGLALCRWVAKAMGRGWVFELELSWRSMYLAFNSLQINDCMSE